MSHAFAHNEPRWHVRVIETLDELPRLLNRYGFVLVSVDIVSAIPNFRLYITSDCGVAFAVLVGPAAPLPSVATRPALGSTRSIRVQCRPWRLGDTTAREAGLDGWRLPTID